MSGELLEDYSIYIFYLVICLLFYIFTGFNNYCLNLWFICSGEIMLSLFLLHRSLLKRKMFISNSIIKYVKQRLEKSEKIL